jgi:hypothetical protein
MWEAMHGSMGGYYEIRVSGPGKVQYRLFCILDNAKNRDELEERASLNRRSPLSTECQNRQAKSSWTATTRHTSATWETTAHRLFLGGSLSSGSTRPVESRSFASGLGPLRLQASQRSRQPSPSWPLTPRPPHDSFADELDCTRTYAAARLRSLERQGLAAATLGHGGSFRWRVTPAGSARLAELPRPPFGDVGGPLARFGRQAAS